MSFFEMATGVGINLFSSGIEAALSRVSTDLKRINAVELAFLSRDDAAQKIAKEGFKDFQKALGRNGIYTVDLNNFLSSLLNSGLMVRLCEAAILFPPVKGSGNRREYRQHTGLYPAFVILFKKHFPQGFVQIGERQFDAAKLYYVIRDALGHSIWHQETPASNKFIHDVRHRSLEADFQAIDDRLAQIFKRPRNGIAQNAEQSALSKADIKSIRSELKRIADNICRKLEDTNIYGPDDRQKSGVKLDEIFVPGNFMPWEPNDFNPEGSSQFSGQSIRFAALVKTAFRTVIVGDPGGGKTTAAQMTALTIARKCRKDDAYLPVVITIRRYEAALSNDQSLNLLDFIVNEIASDVLHSDKSKLKDILVVSLVLGKVFVFFDGLDEIINVGHRKIFTEKVSLFSKQYPLCPIIVTSRKIGYEKAPLPSTFQHYVLSDMTFEQSFSYFEKLSRIVFNVTEEKAKIDASEFMAKTGLDAPDIVGNPLMMALMVWLFHYRGGEMPNTRARLYHECASLMFERWDKQRNISSSLPETFDLYPLLNELASEIYNDASLGAGVSKSWLVDKCRIHFLKYYDLEKDSRAINDAKKVVDFVTGRAWIMTDTGADCYSFTHRTFLEYFFSQSLNDESQTVAELFDIVKPYIEKGMWTVPAHLALQSKMQGRPKSALEVCEKILDISSDISKKSNRKQLVDFMSGVFDYLSTIPESSLAELTRRFVIAALCETDWFHLMINLLRTSNRRRSVIFKAISEVAAEHFSEGNRNVHRIADLCKRIHFALLYSPTILKHNRLFHVIEFTDLVAVAINKASDPINVNSIVSAKLRFDLCGYPRPADGNYGFDMWDQSISHFKRGDWFIADTELMLLRLSEASNRTDNIVLFAINIARSLAGDLRRVPPGAMLAYEAELISTNFPFSKACSSPDHDIAFAAVIIAIAYFQYSQSYVAAGGNAIEVFSDMRKAYFSVQGRPRDDAKIIIDLLDLEEFLFMKRTSKWINSSTIHPVNYFDG